MILSVGHSTLPESDFVALLAAGPVAEVWDIRSYPASRWPWFRREAMARWLPEAGVGYRWVRQLGGRRGAPRRPAPPLPAGGQATRPANAPAAAPLTLFPPSEGGGPRWESEGFEHYMWHMATDEFLAAAGELLLAGRRRNVAIMCAEALWWRCHRSMVSDFVVYAGGDVTHLQPERTSHSEAIGDRLTRYDPAVVTAWDAYLGARSPGE